MLKRPASTKPNWPAPLGLICLFLSLSACLAPGRLPLAPPTPSPSPTAEAVTAPLVSNATGVIRFEQLSLDQGLSQSVVNCLAQDRQGFLWLGTQDGLNRYDGVNFSIYKPDPNDPQSLSDAWVTALYASPDGRLWIGTNRGGLNQYDPQSGKFTRYLHNPKDGASLSAGTVTSLLQDSEGRLWVGTESGLNRFEPANGTFIRFQNDPADPASLSDNEVHALFLDSRKHLWVGTHAGLNLFDPQAETFKRYLSQPGNPASLSHSAIFALAEAPTGQLWIGTASGLNRFDPATEKFTRYLHDQRDPASLRNNTLLSLLVDSRGSLWAGTETGLERFDPKTEEFTHFRHNPTVPGSLSVNQVYALLEDRENNLWVGTWGGGVNKYSRGQDNFGFYRNDPENANTLSDGGVFGLYADPTGVVWAGITERGLDRLDTVRGTVAHYIPDPQKPDSLRSANIWAILRDQQGRLWLGTSLGLEELDEESGKFIHHLDKNDPKGNHGPTIFALFEDSDGNLWLGASQGLIRYDPRYGRFFHYGGEEDPINTSPQGILDIYEDREGYLWLATAEMGLYRFDRQGGGFKRYLHDPEEFYSLSNDKVMDVYQDRQGIFWIATGGGGLNRFDPATQMFTSYTERQGLSNNFIYCVLPDQQANLWLTTNYGVSRFNPQTETFTNYTVSDGLQSNEFNQGACARSRDGTLNFGGLTGLNRFRPEGIASNAFIPPVALIALARDGNPLPLDTTPETTRAITLKWPQNSFEFEFASLSFAEPKKNRYAYRLENFDSDWNTLSQQQSARYTNLPGGTYTLRLKASNNAGVWNETGQTLQVTVIPPFWQTWWFYTLAGLFVAGNLTGLYRLRVRNVEKQKLELERQVRERTSEIEKLFEQTKELAVIEERNRLARDLHDSAKQKAFAALAQIGTANGFIEKNLSAAREHLHEAENLVSDVIQELTFLIQEMYPLALKEKGLATSLREYAYEWEHRTDIPVSVKIEGERRLKLEVEQALYRIVQESLANIARHSQASRAALTVQYTVGKVSLEVADNGRGFARGQSSNGIGLRLIRERAESIGGKISIESEPGRGTRITILIPTETES